MPTQYDADQEPAYRCAHCQRLLYADELARVACRLCEDRARTQLTALPGLYDQLGDALAPGSSASDGGRVEASKSAPLPVNVHVLDLRGPGGVVANLLAIEDSWRQALRWTATPFRGNYEQTIRGTVRFLSINVTWACSSYEEVSFDLDVIRKLHSQSQAATTGERRRRVAVTCLAEYDDSTVCGAELHIDTSAASTRCRTCGASWGREDWVRLHEGVQAAA